HLARRKPTGHGAVLGGLGLALLYLVRPTFLAHVPAFLWCCRRRVGPFLVALGCGLVADSLFFKLALGSLRPPYYHSRVGAEPLMALAGNLVSPGRGLLVFVPSLVVITYLALRHRRVLPAPDLVAASALAVGGTWLASSYAAPWWGGQAYGPRMMADALPWMALASAIT